MNKSLINNYDCILKFKTKIIANDDIINKLNNMVDVIKSLSSNSNFTTIKVKTYNKSSNVPVENKLITLLNLLTDTNKDDICSKIPSIIIKKDSISNLINILHKKICYEYHFIENYIYIIKYIVHSGIYNFYNNTFWNLLIMKCQNIFDTIKDSLTPEDIDIHCGNMILIFYLCKESLLSLQVLEFIFDTIINLVENNNILVNILFKLFDFIPIDSKYLDILQSKIYLLLKKDIPFRLKFKIDQLNDKILSKIQIMKNTKNTKNTKSMKSMKNNNNIILEKLIISLITDFNKNKLLQHLETKIASITNFRKSYFFKIFILNLIKLDIETNNFNTLLNFIYNRKYRPSNYKNIYSQINKTLKKINNNEYNKKFQYITNKKN